MLMGGDVFVVFLNCFWQQICSTWSTIYPLEANGVLSRRAWFDCQKAWRNRRGFQHETKQIQCCKFSPFPPECISIFSERLDWEILVDFSLGSYYRLLKKVDWLQVLYILVLFHVYMKFFYTIFGVGRAEEIKYKCLPLHNVFQRDLDFTIDLDFHGELSEVTTTLNYKMR